MKDCLSTYKDYLDHIFKQCETYDLLLMCRTGTYVMKFIRLDIYGWFNINHRKVLILF